MGAVYACACSQSSVSFLVRKFSHFFIRQRPVPEPESCESCCQKLIATEVWVAAQRTIVGRGGRELGGRARAGRFAIEKQSEHGAPLYRSQAVPSGGVDRRAG